MSYQISYACSRFYKWFVELGYPRLDIIEFGDGEFAIREFETIPIMPAHTSWKYVLQGMRNIEISFPFVKRYVNQIDTMKAEKWAIEDAKSKEVYAEQERLENHREFIATEQTKLVMKNDAIKERIAKNGMSELKPVNILKNLSPAQQRQFGMERTK